MEVFDPMETPLYGLTGLYLVEASAGTGKTYTISSLFLRLLLEFNLNIDDILVITFTNAATNDLKERIRARIKDGINAFMEGDSKDGFLKKLIDKTTDKNHAIGVLTDAIKSFDMASIFTIHGFCMRVLKQFAFESGSLFDTELSEENDEILWEIVKDFWRRHIFNESRFFLNYGLKKLSTNDLYRLGKKTIINPSAFIIEVESNLDKGYFEIELKKFELECIELFERLSSQWGELKRSILDFFESIKSPKGKRQKIEKFKESLEEIDKYFKSGYLLPMPKKIKNPFSDDFLKDENESSLTSINNFFVLLEPFMEKIENLSVFYDRKLSFLKKMFLDYLKKELDKRKQILNTRSFDDLLIDVHRAISGFYGKALKEEISKKYRAILIDEFQDTDPLQYEIIRHIYHTGKTVVFIIGDPKQSIYGFRGADVFSYIKAANDANGRWTLEFNYRSSKRLIKAVNTLFENVKNPFIFRELDFKPVKAAETDNQGDLIVKGKTDPSPLKIWFLENKEKKPIKVNDAIDRISKAVAQEIVSLLYMGEKKEALIDNKPITAKDIAVIVRKNEEASKIQDALNRVGIPGVIYTTDSVFSSDEAKEILRIISAINEPNDESKVKSALATEIMGYTGDGLLEIMEDEKKWNNCLEKFESYRNLWLFSGFITMARSFISSERVKSRLISMENGERKLTNVLHIIELIHRACTEHKLNIEGALKWLNKKIEREQGSKSEEYQMRLETDEEAVKILTIHRSKGLEFPIVFCPFNWRKTGSNSNQITVFHDEKNNYSLTIDIRPNPDESSKKHMEIEELAEDIRLLYVSLTRAKKRCYLVWGRINKADDSGLAYVIYSPSENNKDFFIEGHHGKNLTDEGVKSILNSLVERSFGTIEVIPMPEYDGKMYIPMSTKVEFLNPKTFKGTIDKTWGVVSFSSLVSKRPQSAELADRDEDIMHHLLPFPKPVGKKDIFNFPYGTKAGLFIHDVLEHLDFSLKDYEGFLRLIDEKLWQYGFEKDWLGVISEKLKELFNKILKSNHDTFTLSIVDNKKRLSELEFYLPINMIDASGLGEIFDKYRPFSSSLDLKALIKALGFTAMCGMMRGFIDMVFEHNGRYYIVDWKSNFLGDRIEDYDIENIKKVMLEEYYFLQYHLYTLALHRFLSFKKRDYAYEKHFGGIFYIFIRGITYNADQNGIFFDLPEKTVIEELENYLTVH
ncbi:MAG TPA: exodeoxyribonuclease V subunit beta [Syntrophorhabdaceae bacterium]|nr:exodeoxyribonuclease V subunit beta [Syntrophorhabdaceae bacterium]